MATAKRRAAIQAKGISGQAWMRLDEHGRILAVADPPYHCGDGEMELPMPPAAEGSDLVDWVWRDGVWVHDPLPHDVTPDACFRMEELVEILLSIQELCMGLTMQLEELIQQGKG